MKIFIPLFFALLLANSTRMTAQTACAPPLTVQSVTIAHICQGDEVRIVALPQYNSYYAYLLDATQTVIASAEVSDTFGINVFGMGAQLCSNCRVRVVPVSVNLGALPQYAIVSGGAAAPLPAAASVSNPPQIMNCAGVIDNNIVTRDIGSPPSNPCNWARTPELSVFNTQLFDGTKEAGLITASISNITTPNNCYTDTEYLHYLYDKINTLSTALRFRYTNPSSSNPVKTLDFTFSRRDLGLPLFPPQTTTSPYSTEDYKLFVTAIEAFFKNTVLKYFKDSSGNVMPNKKLVITITP